MPAEISRYTLEFPDLDEADDSGLLAIGGDLSTDRLKLAYSKGIFPYILFKTPLPRWTKTSS